MARGWDNEELIKFCLWSLWWDHTFINAYYQVATNLIDQDWGLGLRYIFGSDGLFVCKHYSESYEWVVMTFYDGVWGGKRKIWLNLGGDLSLLDE